MSDKDQTITLQNENDWSSLLSDKHKENTEVTKFKTVNEMADHIVNMKKIGDLPNKESPIESIMEFNKTQFGLDEKSYSKDFKHSELALKYKLPNKLIEPFMTELESKNKKVAQDDEKTKLEEFRKKVEGEVPKEVFKTRFEAGLKAMGWTEEDYKAKFTPLERNNPDLVIALTKLGKAQYSQKQKDTDAGKDDLPADLGVLRANISDLSAKRMNAKLMGHDTFNIEEKLRQYQLRYNQEQQKQASAGPVQLI